MALGTQSVGKLLDYEQYIEYQIERTRSRIKGAEVLNACLVLSTAGLGALFLEVVLDHLVGLPYRVRAVTLGAGGLLALGFLLKRIVQPLVSPVNGLYAAKAIEDANPTLQNSLISYLDLRRHGSGVPTPFLAAVEAKAVNDLLEIDVETVVDLRGLLRTTYALSGVVVLVVLYAVLTPRSLLDSVRRALLADVHRPTAVQLRNIKPGDQADLSRVVAGATVPFSVETQGARPDRVVLHYREDGEGEDSSLEFAPGQTPFEPWQATLPEVIQSLDYHITAGDAVSRTYHLEVVPAPVRAVDESLASKGLPPSADVEESRAGEREEPALKPAAEGRRRPMTTVERLAKLRRVLENRNDRPLPLESSQERRSPDSKPGQDAPAPQAETNSTVPQNTKTSSAGAVHQADRPTGTGQGEHPQPPTDQAGRPGNGSGLTAGAPGDQAANPATAKGEEAAGPSSPPTKPGRLQDGGQGRHPSHPKEPNRSPIPSEPQPGHPPTGAPLDNEPPSNGKNDRRPGSKGKAKPPSPRGEPAINSKNKHLSDRHHEQEVAKSAPQAVKASGGTGHPDPRKPGIGRSTPQDIQAGPMSSAVKSPRAQKVQEEPTSGKSADKDPPARGKNAEEFRHAERPAPKDNAEEEERPGTKAITKEEPKEPEKEKKDTQLLKTQETKNVRRPHNLPGESPQGPARETPPKRGHPQSRTASEPPDSGQVAEPGEPGPQQLSFPEAGLPGKTPPGLPSGNPGPAGEKPSQVPHENSTSPGSNPSDRSPEAKSSPPRASQPTRKKSASPSQVGESSSRRQGQGTGPASAGLSGRGVGLGTGTGTGLGDGPSSRGSTGTAGSSGEIGASSPRVPGGRLQRGDQASNSPNEGNPQAEAVSRAGRPGRSSGRRSSQAGSQSAGPAAAGDGSNPLHDQQLERQSSPTIGAGISRAPQRRATNSRNTSREGHDSPSPHAGGPAGQDSSKPTPHSTTPLESAAETVAPGDLPQMRSEPVIRQLRELLKQDQVSPEVLDAAGVTSKQELDQFVTTLELARSPVGEPRPGREIEVSRGDPATLGSPPSPTGLDLNPKARLSTTRTRGPIAEDKIRGNIEGSRFLVPPELRAGFKAYRTALSRSTPQSQ